MLTPLSTKLMNQLCFGFQNKWNGRS